MTRLAGSIKNLNSQYYYKLCSVEISEMNANIVDPDQMPRSTVSDLGLHNLPISLLRD